MKKVTKILSISLMIATTTTFVIACVYAYLNDGVVRLDYFGEHHIEFVMVFVILLVMVLYSICVLKEEFEHD